MLQKIVIQWAGKEKNSPCEKEHIVKGVIYM